MVSAASRAQRSQRQEGEQLPHSWLQFLPQWQGTAFHTELQASPQRRGSLSLKFPLPHHGLALRGGWRRPLRGTNTSSRPQPRISASEQRHFCMAAGTSQPRTNCTSPHVESWGGRQNKTQGEIDGTHRKALKACLDPIPRPRPLSTCCSLCLEHTQLSPSHVNSDVLRLPREASLHAAGC